MESGKMTKVITLAPADLPLPFDWIANLILKISPPRGVPISGLTLRLSANVLISSLRDGYFLESLFASFLKFEETKTSKLI
ncbi:MAG: hypothetical protein MUE75_11825 [Algoriphagus sp.]|nr:hypothetical protein [Algoriphagus sp.]